MKYYLFFFLCLLPFVSAELFNESINESISGEQNITEDNTCNISLLLTTDKQIYSNEEKVTMIFKLTNKSQNYKINYWIESLEEEIVKEARETTNINDKSFTPKVEKETVFLAKANITISSCENQGIESSQTLFVVTKELSKEEELEIKKTPEKTNFGKTIDLSLMIYTGNNTNLPISFSLTKENTTLLEEELKVSASFLFSEIIIPLMLPQNCDNVFQEGNYLLTIKTTSKNKTSSIKIENATKSLCPLQIKEIIQEQKCEETTPLQTKNSLSETNIKATSKPLTKGNELSYESSSIKTKNLSPYLFAAALVVLAVILFKGEFHGIYSKSDYRSSRLPGRTYQDSHGRARKTFGKQSAAKTAKPSFKRYQKNKR